jgi:hypothetical protein
MSRLGWAGGQPLMLVGLLAISLSVTSCSGSACDSMRDAQDELADVEARVENGDRFPEDSPNGDEIKAAYEKVARATDACTDEMVRERES